MNENDMDRYLWRTGQRWSGDYRPPRSHVQRLALRLRGRTAVFLFGAFALTMALLLLFR